MKNIPGVEDAFHRLGTAGDDGYAVGPAFEIVGSASLGSRLARMSVYIDGNEVDAELVDGTLVEMKSLPEGVPVDRGLSAKMVAKAVRQLVLRVGTTGRKAILFASRDLSAQQLAGARTSLGSNFGDTVMKPTWKRPYESDERARQATSPLQSQRMNNRWSVAGRPSR